MTDYSGKERRKHPRAYRPFIVAYKRLDDKMLRGKVTQIKDISEGGLAFRSDDEFEMGEILNFHIVLPLTKEAIRVKGKVLGSCRISKDLFCETRVVFTEISNTAKRQIKDAVKHIKKKE